MAYNVSQTYFKADANDPTAWGFLSSDQESHCPDSGIAMVDGILISGIFQFVIGFNWKWGVWCIPTPDDCLQASWQGLFFPRITRPYNFRPRFGDFRIFLNSKKTRNLTRSNTGSGTGFGTRSGTDYLIVQQVTVGPKYRLRNRGG